MKRAFDLCVALLGLVLFAPLLLAISLWIKCSSPGPVLYAQTRVGRFGRPFRLYKFRSMVVGADRMGSSVTTGHDARITPVGRLLRQTKLDELPQLWNVLRGDMSLVGPRPDVPEIVATYTPELRRILEVRPGITSIASLHLRHEDELLELAAMPEQFYTAIVVPAKVNLAMEHVRRDSLLFDLWILWQTLWALSVGRALAPREHPMVVTLRRQAAEFGR